MSSSSWKENDHLIRPENILQRIIKYNTVHLFWHIIDFELIEEIICSAQINSLLQTNEKMVNVVFFQNDNHAESIIKHTVYVSPMAGSG